MQKNKETKNQKTQPGKKNSMEIQGTIPPFKKCLSKELYAFIIFKEVLYSSGG